MKTKEELFNKIQAVGSEQERLRLLYMWVKQAQITQQQFIEYIKSKKWEIKF